MHTGGKKYNVFEIKSMEASHTYGDGIMDRQYSNFYSKLAKSVVIGIVKDNPQSPLMMLHPNFIGK